MMVSGYDLLTTIWFHSLLHSAWAAANWADIAKQFGKTLEQKKCSQQHVVADHHGHFVLTCMCMILKLLQGVHCVFDLRVECHKEVLPPLVE